jgi:hypothetical protein
VVETETYRGVWWTPSSPEEQLAGTLTITDGEPNLDVVGTFGRKLLSETATTRTMSLSLADQQRILGLAADGTQVTLVDCTEANQITHIPGMTTVVYRARAAILGHLFEPDEEIAFEEIEIRTTDLEQWLGYVPFSVERREGPDDDGPVATVSIAPPRAIDAPLADGGRARLRFDIRTSGLGVAAPEARLQHTAWLALGFSARRGLDEAVRVVGQLVSFLTLAVGTPVTLLAVQGYRLGVDRGGDRTPLRLLYMPARNPEPSTRQATAREMLFTFAETRDRFAEILGAWLEHHELLDAVFALYFGTRTNQGLYLEQRFLAFIAAIETYDRRRRPQTKERDPNEHKQRLREIVEAAPEHHRTWLKDQLAFSNELSLAQRLEHVLGACEQVTEQIVGPQGLTGFVRAVRDTRNYYTHWDPRGQRKAATGRDLYRLTLQLQTVLEIVFLLELEFECERILRVLKRARRFERIALQR